VLGFVCLSCVKWLDCCVVLFGMDADGRKLTRLRLVRGVRMRMYGVVRIRVILSDRVNPSISN